MAGADEFNRILDNLYRRVFEQNPPKFNTPLRNTATAIEEIAAVTEDVSPATTGVEYPVAARWYEDLTTSGSDPDADPSIYKIAAGQRVQYGAGVLDETAMVLVFRIRPDFASGDVSQHILLDWNDDATHRITVDFDGSGNWRVQRADGTTDTKTVSDAFSSGDKRTLTIVLTATQIGIAIDDGAISLAASTNIPTLTSALFDIGSDGASNHSDAGYLWMFIGTGSAVDDDVDIFDANGDTDPEWPTLTIDQFPNLDLSFLWHGVDGAHEVMSNRWGETNYAA